MNEYEFILGKKHEYTVTNMSAHNQNQSEQDLYDELDEVRYDDSYFHFWNFNFAILLCNMYPPVVDFWFI